jgi:hypothetical protein
MFWKSAPKVYTAASTKQARVYLLGDAFCTKPGVLGLANERLCVSEKDVIYSCKEHQFDAKMAAAMGNGTPPGKLRVSDDKKSCVNIP